MNAEQARKLATAGFEQLSHALARGKSEALVAYLAALARFHAYSFSNVMLIVSQRPAARRVAGFQTWKSLGRYVKKGEKGIVILAPMLLRKRVADESKVGSKVESSERDEKVLRFRAVYVFDVEQTDGAPLPDLARVTGDPQADLTKLEEFIRDQGIELSSSETLGAAQGISRGGAIAVDAKLAPAERFAVLVHELAHEMLHQKDRRHLPTKTVRETEAEAVAFIVSQAIGLSTGNAAADYIQLYDGCGKTLEASLERIQQTAATIIEALR